jgi:hypothetical protein
MAVAQPHPRTLQTLRPSAVFEPGMVRGIVVAAGWQGSNLKTLSIGAMPDLRNPASYETPRTIKYQYGTMMSGALVATQSPTMLASSRHRRH